MKIEWAKKIAEVIQEVYDPHGSPTATAAIIGGLCARLNAAFPEFEFKLRDRIDEFGGEFAMEPGGVAVKKKVSTYSGGKTEQYQG